LNDEQLQPTSRLRRSVAWRNIPPMKAIEVTGTVDAQHRLTLDQPLPADISNRVRVIILVPEDGEIDERAWYAAAAKNPAFEFLRESAEDIYTAKDGKPFHD
jgi:hypothetical protein